LKVAYPLQPSNFNDFYYARDNARIVP
jgi:hypothetical protein